MRISSLNGPSMNYYAYDQNGNLVGSGGQPLGGTEPGQAMANYQKFFLDQQRMGDDAVRMKMANAFDANGDLRVRPQTQAEFAEVERQAQVLANKKSRDTLDQLKRMVGYGSGGGGVGATAASADPWDSRSMAASGGGSAGGYPMPQVDEGINSGFKTALLQAISSPGIDRRTQQDMVNSANEGLATAQTNSEQDLIAAANAAGFTPAGGSVQGGLQRIGSEYAGQKADNARKINIDVENARKGLQLSALGQAGSYLNTQNNTLADWYKWKEGRNRDDRNIAMGLLKEDQPAIPSLTGGGYGMQNLSFGGVAGGNDEAMPGLQMVSNAGRQRTPPRNDEGGGAVAPEVPAQQRNPFGEPARTQVPKLPQVPRNPPIGPKSEAETPPQRFDGGSNDMSGGEARAARMPQMVANGGVLTLDRAPMGLKKKPMGLQAKPRLGNALSYSNVGSY